jgi:hypothetical protein
MHLDRVFAVANSEQLKAILLAVSSRVSGLSPSEVDQLCADVAALEPDDDVLLEPEISFCGAALPFAINVFKDAEGALEVVFLLATDLTSMVQDVACAAVGKSAVRSIVT